MTIDINKLRKLAQAATPGPWYIGSGTYEGRNIYSAKAVTDDEGFTYNPVVATAEDDGVVCWDANARLIVAANPAAITELLDRLEAAEAEALEQARLNGMGSEREAALMAKLEMSERELERERMRLAACGVAALGYFNGCAKEYTSASLDDVLSLRAKIEAVEAQEPVAEWIENKFDQYPQLIWDEKYKAVVGTKLYALPGAKGE